MRKVLLALVLALALLPAACGEADREVLVAPAAAGLQGELRIFAAASLREAFTALGDQFEVDHPDVSVSFNFAASSALAEQIDQGAASDVFAAADEATVRQVLDAGHAADATVFARNRLAILVEKGNPKAITGLADLVADGLVLVVCAPEVPCGKYAAAAFAKAGITPAPASVEENVKAVVTKVTLGEADAGIVYATDVQAAGDEAEGVAIDIAGDPALEVAYPVAVTKASTNRAAATAWIEFVLSDAGQDTLRSFGFLAP